jgi:hypothetical protein
MKVFHCDHCDQLVFFENTRCVHCTHRLGFVPEAMAIRSLDQGGEYRLCRNYTEHDVCNWVITPGDPHDLCQSCRLTRVIPDLAAEGHKVAWYRLEVAKRRVIYTLMNLGLPIDAADEHDGEGLAFQFMADTPGGDAVLTGHSNGVITINVAEADDAERERRRNQLGEPYRTLLGHMRHEIGHYYWDVLVHRDPDRLARFRELFGDDREDYPAALKRYYDQGPAADWQERFVSAYASAHAWEDWAETWAHYLHMTDTLEMAASCGVSLRPRRAGEPSLASVPASAGTADGTFDALIHSWFPLTYMLNNLNRGLGQADAYPFVLSTPAIEKLRFVHKLMKES